jgi:predicted short-subunit dehydrogenase-like oxidoreductase (DUF2520 family)
VLRDALDLPAFVEDTVEPADIDDLDDDEIGEIPPVEPEVAAVAAGCVTVVRHGEPVAGLAERHDIVVIATPDAVIADVSASVRPSETCVVAHLSGALGLDVLAPHSRRGSLHPLVSMPDASLGAARLRGAWMAIDGDPLMWDLAVLLDGRAFAVAAADRVRYHAAAAIASNHVVALLGQVERIADAIGVPAEAFWDLARGAIDNVVALGPGSALTGPVARGDWATVHAHLAALPADERAGYRAAAELAARLAGVMWFEP